MLGNQLGIRRTSIQANLSAPKVLPVIEPGQDLTLPRLTMSTSILPNRVQILKQKFTQSWGLPNRSLLSESMIAEALKAEEIKYRRRLFDPFVTLWTFLSQVLDSDKTCHNAVSRAIAWLAAENVEIPAVDTSAYCQARKRLPEKLLQRLFGQVAAGLEKQVTADHLWCGRHVLRS